jgi:hypothetical protein
MKTTARWPKYETAHHPHTFIIKDTDHLRIRHVGCYSWTFPNGHYPKLRDGIWAEIGGYQNTQYLLDVHLTLPNRSRYQFNYREVAPIYHDLEEQCWESAVRMLDERVTKAAMILMRVRSMHEDGTPLGHRPPYAERMRQLWNAGPLLHPACGCNPGISLCPEGQRLWDDQKQYITTEHGYDEIWDLEAFRDTLRHYYDHFARPRALVA